MHRKVYILLSAYKYEGNKLEEAGIGWKWLEMARTAGNGCDRLEWPRIAERVWN